MAALKTSSLEEMELSLWFTDLGILSKLFGGWLLCVWTYKGESFGYGNMIITFRKWRIPQLFFQMEDDFNT